MNRWSNETEDLLAREVYAFADSGQGLPGYDDDDPDVRDACREGARQFLTKLADAGLLVPSAARRREQRGVLNEATGQVSVCPDKPCEHTKRERQRERVCTVVSFTTPWTTGSPE